MEIKTMYDYDERPFDFDRYLQEQIKHSKHKIYGIRLKEDK